MDCLLTELHNWQTLIGAFLGGAFALLVALLVSYRVQRRDEITSSYLIIGTLVTFHGAMTAFNKRAKEEKISAEDYSIWICENLLFTRPKLSVLYEQSMSRIMPKDENLGAHLSLINTFYLGISAPLSRIEEEFKYQQIYGKYFSSENKVKADADLVEQGMSKISAHSECAIYLIEKLVTSKIPTINRIRMYLCPNEMNKKSTKLIKTGET